MTQTVRLANRRQARCGLWVVSHPLVLKSTRRRFAATSQSPPTAASPVKVVPERQLHGGRELRALETDPGRVLLRRMTVKTTVAVVLCLVLCAGSTTLARAVCAGASVNSFGAKGDGHTDDTAAIQSAITAVGSAGGGSVVFSAARYFTSGTFVVPRGVVLCGVIEGPFDVAGVNPAVTTIAPTLLITSTTGPFLTLQGFGAGATDLLFHYPNQVAPSAAMPLVYP